MVGACCKKSTVDTPSCKRYKVPAIQTEVVPGTDGARISCLCEGHILTTTFYDGVETLYDAFQRGVSVSGDGDCLGWKPAPNKPYQWLSYNEVNSRVKAFGSGLINLGVPQSNNARIGIYSQNRPEYTIADLAFYHHSLTGVPLYDTLGEDACRFIINQADLSTIICDNNTKIKALLDRWLQFPGLRTLIVVEPLNNENRSLALSHGVKLMQFHEVENLGKDHPVEEKHPRPNDLAMICYTSGTTGTPKGAMLTHGNLIACISAGLKHVNDVGFSFTMDDCIISYLPLAHSYERVLEYAMVISGARIGFYQGEIKKLMDDIKELRPTVFPSVPRLLNRFYDKIMAGVASSKIKRMLFNMAVKSKTKELKSGLICNNSIWDRYVFRKIQEALGGRIRLMTTGSAPMAGNVLNLLRCIVGCPLIEGYGQTENTAVCAINMLGDAEIGHVGPPLPCNMIKLIDVPEMNYSSENNTGEICVKGPNIFLGYLKDEEKTKEALKDGWLHTGDIGEWLPNGTLRIIDRKKQIFKLSQGEYIAPEKIENILVQSQWVSQIFVHGSSLQSCLVAIVVPDPETLPGLAKKIGVNEPFEKLVKLQAVKEVILKDLAEVGKKHGLSSLEQVKDILLYPEFFTVENGFLTPTFKIVRFELVKFFAKDFDAMYDRLAAST